MYKKTKTMPCNCAILLQCLHQNINFTLESFLAANDLDSRVKNLLQNANSLISKVTDNKSVVLVACYSIRAIELSWLIS